MSRHPLVTASSLLLVGLAACGDQDDYQPIHEDVTQESSSLYASSGVFWPRGIINVCFETPGFATERAWVQAAALTSWGRHSAVDFAYFGNCTPTLQGLHVTFDNTIGNSHAGLGYPPSGIQNMFLETESALLHADPTMCAGSLRQRCVMSVAIHELGHVLGFQHEVLRPDRTCPPASPGVPGAFAVGNFDNDSVMSGCGGGAVPPIHRWTLSAGDIKGVRHIYGGPTARLGLFSAGAWSLDYDGDFVWSRTGSQSAPGVWQVAPDKFPAAFGISSDFPVGGAWGPWTAGVPTAVDKLGAFRNGEWFLDRNGDGVYNSAVDPHSFFGQAGDVPVPGRWNTTLLYDVIGVWRSGTWFLDFNASGVWDAGDRSFAFGQAGDQPIVGLWNGAVVFPSADCFGVRRSTGEWFLDWNCNQSWDGTAGGDVFYARFPAVPSSSDVAVAGDWDNTGRTRIGVYRKDSNGDGIQDAGVWMLDMNGDGVWSDTLDRRVFPPAGTWKPVVGRW